MFETLKDQAPQFFNYHNLVFILEAMGRTLGMTIIGCTVGFVFGLMIALLRHSTYLPLLPLRLIAIAYVETFRRIPFLVILFIVLFVVVAIAIWIVSEWRANRMRNMPRLWMFIGQNVLAVSFLMFNPVKAYLAFAFSHAVEYMIFVWAFQRRRYDKPLPHKPLLQRVLRHPATAYIGYHKQVVQVTNRVQVPGGDMGKKVDQPDQLACIGVLGYAALYLVRRIMDTLP